MRSNSFHLALAAVLASFLISVGFSPLVLGDSPAATAAAAKDKDKEGKDLGGWRAPEAARKVPNPTPPAAESVARGKELFDKTCARCHGAEGHGDGKMAKALAAKPADLTLRLPPQSDGEIFWKVTEGKSPMPSFKKDLTPEQRWDVVNFLRHGILAKNKAAAGDSAAAKSKAAAPGTPKAAEKAGS
jgi:mono/diheme cytochrome c family protein